MTEGVISLQDIFTLIGDFYASEPPKERCFPLMVTFQAWWQLAEDAGVKGLPGSGLSPSAPSPGPFPPPPPSLRFPPLCSWQSSIVNLIEGFVPSILAHQFGESPAWELADIVRQPGVSWPLFQEVRGHQPRIINRRTAE